MSDIETNLPSLTPPLKFNAIQPGIFRGSYPRPINYEFLRTLNLKTMISIVEKPISFETDANLNNFIKENDINLIHIECSKGGKGKKRNIPIDYPSIVKVIEIIIDNDNSPCYIFCINGGQITSLVVACIRKISFWSSISIFNEFITYSNAINHNDRLFIEKFQGEINLPTNRVPWIWNGLSKVIIENHPTLKFKENKAQITGI
ncbi:hypothetical protein PACTADRAFT_74612 [Pachysolen tannophilus NRRL Y-2460]|uniref:Tyrosine-protein phosphatase OCA6 n=1 Tax=Pachysolen tannophilus NRRL Y-2460 TaxID=669874 RepID=A0A1E4TZ58_PACTA|nr:hypothetical protein PACTADRAFT_74612 [Pachysolen tannophilus NRRL Y-2460]